MNTHKSFRTILSSVAILGASAAFIGGCGDGGVDQSKLNDVKKQGQEIQADAKKLTANADQIRADIASGKITAEEGQKQLTAQTDAITAKANKASSTAIDAVKDNKYLSDDDKKQLEDAQAKLNAK
jgi:outer membrane murein-binding lipoprotein Lpp